MSDADFVSNNQEADGDLCAVDCTLPNSEKVTMASINITRKSTVNDITDFIHRALLAYTQGGPILMKKIFMRLR